MANQFDTEKFYPTMRSVRTYQVPLPGTSAILYQGAVATGMLVVFAKQKNMPPRAVREKEALLEEFQNLIRSRGIQTHWTVELFYFSNPSNIYRLQKNMLEWEHSLIFTNVST